MSITTLIILLVVAIGILFLYDSSKKTAAGERPAKTQGLGGKELTADEEETTLTGKFRVEQMLKETKKTEAPSKEPPKASSSVADQDEENLPDPFADDEQ